MAKVREQKSTGKKSLASNVLETKVYAWGQKCWKLKFREQKSYIRKKDPFGLVKKLRSGNKDLGNMFELAVLRHSIYIKFEKE